MMKTSSPIMIPSFFVFVCIDVKFDEFVNEITFPSIDVFRQYWKSNIYYDSKYDSDFELYAKKHFETHNNFQYSKKAEIITMKSPMIL